MQVTHPDVSFKCLKQREDVCTNKITQWKSALRRRWLIVPRGCFSQIFSVIDWVLFNHAENIWQSFWGQFTVTLSNSPTSLPACFVFLAVNHIFYLDYSSPNMDINTPQNPSHCRSALSNFKSNACVQSHCTYYSLYSQLLTLSVSDLHHVKCIEKPHYFSICLCWYIFSKMSKPFKMICVSKSVYSVQLRRVFPSNCCKLGAGTHHQCSRHICMQVKLTYVWSGRQWQEQQTDRALTQSPELGQSVCTV